jgi:hypothetical protein
MRAELVDSDGHPAVHVLESEEERKARQAAHWEFKRRLERQSAVTQSESTTSLSVRVAKLENVLNQRLSYEGRELERTREDISTRTRSLLTELQRTSNRVDALEDALRDTRRRVDIRLTDRQPHPEVLQQSSVSAYALMTAVATARRKMRVTASAITVLCFVYYSLVALMVVSYPYLIRQLPASQPRQDYLIANVYFFPAVILLAALAVRQALRAAIVGRCAHLCNEPALAKLLYQTASKSPVMSTDELRKTIAERVQPWWGLIIFRSNYAKKRICKVQAVDQLVGLVIDIGLFTRSLELLPDPGTGLMFEFVVPDGGTRGTV